MAPISLAILNPIGYVLMEISNIKKQNPNLLTDSTVIQLSNSPAALFFNYFSFILGTSTFDRMPPNCWFEFKWWNVTEEQIEASRKDHAIDLLQSNFTDDRVRSHWRCSLPAWSSRNYIRLVKHLSLSILTGDFHLFNVRYTRSPTSVWEFFLCNGFVLTGTSYGWKSTRITRTGIFDTWHSDPSKIVSFLVAECIAANVYSNFCVLADWSFRL